MCELRVINKGCHISRWLPQLQYQLRGEIRYSEPISSPFVAATCNTRIMTKSQVRLAPTAEELFTNPSRLQHIHYTDFILREVIFFCKMIFKLTPLFFNTERKSFPSFQYHDG